MISSKTAVLVVNESENSVEDNLKEASLANIDHIGALSNSA